MKNYERAKKAEDFASGSVQNSASLSLSVQPFIVLRRVLVWRSEATPLVIDKHTPPIIKYFMASSAIRLLINRL